MNNSILKNKKIAVVGLGYVGLPLAVELAKLYPTIGLDINSNRIAELKSGSDLTLEVKDSDLNAVLVDDLINNNRGLLVTDDKATLSDCDIYIVTVPTPTDKHHRPVLTPLYTASETVGEHLKVGDIVVYESTVYPGVTEEECVPVLERVSELTYNKDFYCGYSPERINPGDKEHTVTKILKVTSGSTPETADIVDELYKSIIVAGTFKASCIKVAEAAKVIENSQRDINIAFVNELSKIFNLLDIDTNEVLEAAGTKWNFLPFNPGLVGGHCIGVDPYYLAQKAQEVGYHPEIILAGRRMNDSMGSYISTEIIKLMVNKDIRIKGASILMLGITFKENCPDIRNTKAIDVHNALEEYGTNIEICDPWASEKEVEEEFGVKIVKSPSKQNYQVIVLTVAHQDFKKLDILRLKAKNGVLYDVKGFLDSDFVDKRL